MADDTSRERAIAVGRAYMSWAEDGSADPQTFLSQAPVVDGKAVAKDELRTFFDLAEPLGQVTSIAGDGEKYLRVHLTSRGHNCLRVTGGDIERYRTGPWDVD